MHHEMERRIEEDENIDLVPETHALGSCLKASTTRLASDGIEELRRACGGHGFSTFSGLDEIYGNSMVSFTGEGECYMIVQQTTRWLFKAHRELRAKGWNEADVLAAGPNLSWLRDSAQLDSETCPAGSLEEMLDPAVLLAAFEHRAARMVAEASEQILEAEANGEDPWTSANDAQWLGISCAFAFGDLLMVRAFIQGLDTVPEGSQEVMSTLCSLFALWRIDESIGDFLLDGYLNREQARMVRQAVNQLMTSIRPEAVALMDCLGYSDLELNSAIGRSDGNVYGTLLAWARREPLNDGEVAPGLEEHLLPLLKQRRQQLEAETGKSMATRPGVVQTVAQQQHSKL